ncbi:MAG: cardiolipin synthase ClsB [Pseudomonadota bacterium]|jgi:cardiolipin synthase
MPLHGSLRPDAPDGETGDGIEPLAWYLVPRPVFRGDNQIDLLRGGDALFPAMIRAIRAARHEVWLATYIFHDDAATREVTDALVRAARRGVRVRVVIDGFGSHDSLAAVEPPLREAGIAVAVFRPLSSWMHWLQPGQLRRLHMKLCVVDGETGFVGGINLIDDRIDLHHGRTELPRLDFAVGARGPVVRPMEQAVRAMWSRAWFGRDWQQELRTLLRTDHPLRRARAMVKQMRLTRRGLRLPMAPPAPEAMLAAFVVRDNVRQRRTIERAYVEAIREARERIWLISPYFYPGQEFRRALCRAARRGVQVRLLMQGKPDYRIAAMAARVLYDELLRHGVEIYEYLPAFLHAKVMLVDDRWATVGSSNIDPISLLLNLEANMIVRDEAFSADLAREIGLAIGESEAITAHRVRSQGWAGLTRRALVAWAAHVYLRVAGVTGRY